MPRNAESLLSDKVREALEMMGCRVIRLSDRYIRGVPDLLVMGAHGIVLVELKIGDHTKHVERNTNQLGLTGPQDMNVRGALRRCRKSACVVTGLADGSAVMLWVPVAPSLDGDVSYRVAASGMGSAADWISS